MILAALTYLLICMACSGSNAEASTPTLVAWRLTEGTWCSVDKAEPVLQRGLPTREGLLSCGERGRIANSSLPNPGMDRTRGAQQALQVCDSSIFIPR